MPPKLPGKLSISSRGPRGHCYSAATITREAHGFAGMLTRRVHESVVVVSGCSRITTASCSLDAACDDNSLSEIAFEFGSTWLVVSNSHLPAYTHARGTRPNIVLQMK